MTSTPPTPTRSRRDAVGASSVFGASLWSALVTFLVMILAAWALPQEQTTVVLTFLAVLFAIYGVLSGVALEATRSIAAGLRDGQADGPVLWQVAVMASSVAAVVVLALTPFWRARVLHEADGVLVAVLAVAVAGYGFHCVLVGAASGRAWWSEAALVIAGEATMRIVVTLAVVAVAASVTSMGLASAAGALAWLVLLAFSQRARRALFLRADVAGPALARRMSASVLAQGSSAILVVGFPILLAATTDRVEYTSAAPLLVAISVTRAPVLLPLNALQGVAVSHLVRARSGIGRILVRLLALVAVVASGGAAAAWLVGPTLLRALGPAYVVDGSVLAALTLAAGGMAALTLTGACAQALAAHAWYVAGWAVAVLTCVVLLQVPGSMAWRSCLALGLAPLTGLGIHLVGLARMRRVLQTEQAEVADA